MLDMTDTAAAAADWTTIVAPGDVVLFAFPTSDDGASPKRRPCLVLDVDRRPALTLVEIAYGTTAETNANTGHEIRVRTPEGMQAAGLERPTRFVAARRLTVSAAHPGFGVRADGRVTPVVGRLDAALMARLDVVRGRIHAVRDVVAERRKKDPQRVTAASGASVVVEWRQRRRAQTAASARSAR